MVELYIGFDPNGSKSVDEITLHFNWSRYAAYTCKYFISELSSEELVLLDKTNGDIDFNVIADVCIQNKKYKTELLSQIERVNAADSPFTEIEIVIKEIAGEDPLARLTADYWIEVGEYLTNRRIDQYPFTKKTIGFIKSIGYKGFKNLSRNQKEWINGLIEADKSRPQNDRFFVNEHLIYAGHKSDCMIVENYQACH